jgi:hypothetical protein
VTLHARGTANETAYTRSSRVLWRDTGSHVLALLSGSPGRRPVLLTGGAVMLWRALEDPGELDALVARLRVDDAGPPSRAEVASTMSDLRAHGLVVITPETGGHDADATFGH